MEWWKEAFPEEDRKIYEAANMGKQAHIGNKPALLVIDVLNAFVGTRAMPIKEAMEEFSASCGEFAWDALPYIQKALQASRSTQVPVIFVKGDIQYKATFGAATKRSLGKELQNPIAYEVHDMVKPLEEEYILSKTGASAFFNTPLAVTLNKLGVDSLILTGGVTSGCVRATAVDGHSHGFPIFVLEEACFDRSMYSHQNNLFELNAKYATVTQTEHYCEHVRSLQGSQ